jgi:hypothetical protein
MGGLFPKPRKPGRPHVLGRAAITTTIRITPERYEWVKKAGLKDRRFTLSNILNEAVSSLMLKEQADRDPTPEEVSGYLSELRGKAVANGAVADKS